MNILAIARWARHTGQRLRTEPLPQTTAASLLQAQSEALSHQIPLLYTILAINILTAAYTFFGKAPWPLAMLVPGLLVTLCVVRTLAWLRRDRQQQAPTLLLRRLRQTSAIAFVVCLAFLGWLYRLYQYGDDAMRGQLISTFGMTFVCCITCLMHVRSLALIVAGSTVPPIALFLMCSSSPTLRVIGVDLLLVAIVMAYMALRLSRDFAQMVIAQSVARELSDVNHRLASTDNLTGLPNRRQFFEQLSQLFSLRATSGRFYVGILDLDGFKTVNDVFGHAAGDRVLRECSVRLRAACGGEVFIARLGGDEFGLLFDGIEAQDTVMAIAARLADSIRAPFPVGDHMATLSTSIGLADFPNAASTPQQLYERADYALYFAKQNQRGAPVLFDIAHEERMRAEARIEQGLRHQNIEQQLSLNFLPIVDVSTGRMVALEALARWQSPELGTVPPARFIPIAERSDLIHEITCILLRKALQSAAAWPADVRLSFNLSARDLISGAAVARIMRIVEEGPLPAARIDFEITETALMSDFASASRSIEALKMIGARISLDDFGTGYSSLSYVHRLPLDSIKIDRSFVREMASSELARGIVNTIITMCGKLGLPCVSEGIETEAELQLLRSYGCQWAQGYYFGEPVGLDAIADFMAVTARTPAPAPAPSSQARPGAVPANDFLRTGS